MFEADLLDDVSFFVYRIIIVLPMVHDRNYQCFILSFKEIKIKYVLFSPVVTVLRDSSSILL